MPTSAFKVDPLTNPTISGMSRGARNSSALFILSVLKFRESHQQRLLISINCYSLYGDKIDNEVRNKRIDDNSYNVDKTKFI